MKYLAIKFPLPKPAAPVAQREVSVTVNNGPARVSTLPGAALVSEEMIFRAGDTYSVTLVDIDANGNRSTRSKAMNGNVKEDMTPATPAQIGPLTPESKRFLNDGEAKQAVAQQAAKIEQEQKADIAKAQEVAKAEETRREALAKIDEDAAEAKAKLEAAPAIPVAAPHLP
jgi:hypothetical protein